MAPSHCGYVGRRPVRGAVGKASHRKATAKLVNPNGLCKTGLRSPSISAAKLQPRYAAYLRSIMLFVFYREERLV